MLTGPQRAALVAIQRGRVRNDEDPPNGVHPQVVTRVLDREWARWAETGQAILTAKGQAVLRAPIEQPPRLMRRVGGETDAPYLGIDPEAGEKPAEDPGPDWELGSTLRLAQEQDRLREAERARRRRLPLDVRIQLLREDVRNGKGDVAALRSLEDRVEKIEAKHLRAA